MPDRDSFVELILTHERDLRAFIGSLLLDRNTSEDVSQECAMTRWREFDRYDAGVTSVGTHLASITIGNRVTWHKTDTVNADRPTSRGAALSV